MYKWFYKGMSFTDLPLFAMLLFLTIFLLVVVRVTFLKRKADFEPLARLPLEDDTAHQEARS